MCCTRKQCHYSLSGINHMQMKAGCYKMTTHTITHHFVCLSKRSHITVVYEFLWVNTLFPTFNKAAGCNLEIHNSAKAAVSHFKIWCDHYDVRCWRIKTVSIIIVQSKYKPIPIVPLASDLWCCFLTLYYWALSTINMIFQNSMEMPSHARWVVSVLLACAKNVLVKLLFLHARLFFFFFFGKEAELKNSLHFF